MKLVRSGLLLSAIVFTPLAFCLAQQSPESQNIFTISVASPTSAKDVQVRYYFTGEFGGFGSSIAAPTDDNKILIKTGVENKSAKTFKLIAYAPGCQFVTISVDDLGSSSRQGQFECTKLNTVQLFGHANVAAFSDKALQVQALYGCDWAGEFFGMTGTVSPFTLGKADIASDGSFTISLPDFSADPLWDSRSNNATLMFLAADSGNGQPLAALKVASAGGARGGGLKVAPTYAPVDFAVQSN